MLTHKKKKKRLITKAQNRGFNILSSILKFKISIIKKLMDPTNPTIIIFKIFRDCCSKIHKIRILIARDTINPDK